MRRRAVLSLWLVLAAVPAGAADLYRWIDPDGREAIGTVPPPGVDAVPWKPGKAGPPPAAAASEPATAASPTPASPAAAPAPLSPAARAALEREERCQHALRREDEKRAAIHQLQGEIATLDAKLAKLQSSEVAFSRMDCKSDPDEARGDCTSQVFDRDQEIERLEESLAKTHEELDDLELGARTVPEEGCE